MSRKFYLAPSLLAADPLFIAESVEEVLEAADWLHLDIMDGHFAPNLSYGPHLSKSIVSRFGDKIVCDAHLMVDNPEKWIDVFAETGVQYISIHIEATPHIHRAIQMIVSHGIHPGVVVNPGTNISLLEPVLDMVDLVLVMSVNPGFGGQKFIPGVLTKVRWLVEMRKSIGAKYLIQMDGGIGEGNAQHLVQEGVDVLVVGNSIFSDPSPLNAAKRIRCSAEEALENRE